MQVHVPGRSEHFKSGYQSFANGDPVNACPHRDQFSIEFMDWVLGWNEAKQNSHRTKQ
jgi:ribosome modulation factor